MYTIHKARPRSTLLAAALLASTTMLPAPGFADPAPAGADRPSSTPAASAETPDADNSVGAAKKPDRQGSDNARDDRSPKGGTPNTSSGMGGNAKDQRATDEQAFTDARIAALHAGLTLTPDQESLWPPVEAAIRELQQTRGHRLDREQAARILRETPSDLLRMRSEHLVRRGEALKKLVDATGPLLDKLDDTQKRRLPLLLDGLRPPGVLRAAFDIRFGRVQDEPDDEADTRASRRGDEGDDADGRYERDGGMGRGHRHMEERDGDYRDRDDGMRQRHDFSRGDDDRT